MHTVPNLLYKIVIVGRTDFNVRMEMKLFALLAIVFVASSDGVTKVGKTTGLVVKTETSKNTPLTNSDKKNDLIDHLTAVLNASQVVLTKFGSFRSWTLEGICKRPPFGQLSVKSSSSSIKPFLEPVTKAMTPCQILSPLMCFWEGAKLLGPTPPVPIEPSISVVIPSLDKVFNLSWANFNPKMIASDITGIGDFEGTSSGFQEKWCIDPLDFDCPKAAPNHFRWCEALENLKQKNITLPDEKRIYFEEERVETCVEIESRRKRRQRRQTSSSLAELRQKLNKVDPYQLCYKERFDCLKHRTSFKSWMIKNADKWAEYIDETFHPKLPSYAEVLNANGNKCGGFSENIWGQTDYWPKTIETVLLLSEPKELYGKLKSLSLKSGKIENWSMKKAASVITAWETKFSSGLLS